MHFLNRRSPFLFLLCSSFFVSACSWFAEDGEDPGPFPPIGGGGGFAEGGGCGFDVGCFGGGFGNSRMLEPLTVAEDSPPPIAGGTLYFSESTGLVLASDPDRDAVFVIDAAASGTAVPLATVALEPGDEPGRIGEAGGRFWVALRSGGGVVAIDPADWTAERFAVCAAPRGVAGEGDVVHVACESGDLVTLDAATGAESRRVFIEPDLRDVVVATDGLYVSQFRRPAVMKLDGAGAVVTKATIAPMNGFEPSVLYQMVADPDEGVDVVHQYGNTAGVPFESEPNAYGQSGCAAINVLGLAHVKDEVVASTQLGAVTLPVSIAVDDFTTVVIDAGALNDGSFTSDFADDDGVLITEFMDLTLVSTIACDLSPRFAFEGFGGFVDGRQVVAAVTTPFGVFLQSRDPWQVVGPGLEVSLPGPNPKDTGHDLFHERAGASIACATCHAEGADDGLVWRFDGFVARRTNDLRGGILATAPFHWDGAHVDMNAIMVDAFTTRMSGPFLDASYAGAVAGWIDSVGMPAASLGASDADVVAGEAIFERADVGCTTCHAAPLFTNNQTLDVGTGGAFQVPSLVGVGHRVAYLHDGCAQDLEAAIRAEACTVTDTGTHGDVSSLSEAEVAQLVAYLRSL